MDDVLKELSSVGGVEYGEGGPSQGDIEQRGERRADHPVRGPDPLPGDPGPRERHPFRAVRVRVQDPLPRGRRALRDGPAAAAPRAAGHLARQGHGEPQHRRAPPAAGRAHPAQHRRPRGGPARLHAADPVRRERRAARARPLLGQPRPRNARDAPVHLQLPARDHREAQRHLHRHRADRLGQDDDALRLPAQDQQRRDASCSPPRTRSSTTSRG